MVGITRSYRIDGCLPKNKTKQNKWDSNSGGDEPFNGFFNCEKKYRVGGGTPKARDVLSDSCSWKEPKDGR